MKDLNHLRQDSSISLLKLTVSSANATLSPPFFLAERIVSFLFDQLGAS